MIHNFTIEILGIEYPAMAKFTWIPFIPGAREDGIPIEPDEAAHAEIHSVTFKINDDWIEIPISEKDEEDLQEQIAESME